METNENLNTKADDRILDAAALQDTSAETYRKILILTSTALIAAVVFMLALMALAQNSLPGEKLYSFKTNVAEELTAMTKLSTNAKTAYATTRLEKRVTELKMLAADNASSSPENLNQVASLSVAHAETVMGTLNNNDAFPLQSKINALGDLQNILRAQETLADDAVEFAPIADSISTIEKTTAEALRGTIHEFASTTDKVAVEAFISEELSEVSDVIANLTPGSKAQSLVFNRISDTNDSISEGEYGDALRYIFKAQEAIAVDTFLYNTERGFVEGQSKEISGEIPEGS